MKKRKYAEWNRRAFDVRGGMSDKAKRKKGIEGLGLNLAPELRTPQSSYEREKKATLPPLGVIGKLRLRWQNK